MAYNLYLHVPRQQLGGKYPKYALKSLFSINKNLFHSPKPRKKERGGREIIRQRPLWRAFQWDKSWEPLITSDLVVISNKVDATTEKGFVGPLCATEL